MWWCRMSAVEWLVMAASWLGILAWAAWSVARIFPAPRRSSPRVAVEEWFASGDIDDDLYRRLQADLDAGPAASQPR